MLLRCLTRPIAWLLSCQNRHDPNSIRHFTQAPQNGRNRGLSALMTTRYACSMALYHLKTVAPFCASVQSIGEPKIAPGSFHLAVSAVKTGLIEGRCGTLIGGPPS